jgi:SAM-dependent MidA family methyltransferase
MVLAIWIGTFFHVAPGACIVQRRSTSRARFRKIDQSVERNAGAVSRGHGYPRARVIQFIDSPHTTEEEAENSFEALERLVGPEEMGARCKVLAIARIRQAST